MHKLLNLFRSNKQKLERLASLHDDLLQVQAERDLIAENYQQIMKAVNCEDFTCKQEIENNPLTGDGYIRAMADIKHRERKLQKEITYLESLESISKALELENKQRAIDIVKALYKQGKVSLETYNRVSGSKTDKGQTRYADVMVINTKGELLLLKRSIWEDSHKGAWVIPGGHVDEGEDDASAAARELYEESGISVDKLRQNDQLGVIGWSKVGVYEDDKAHICYYMLSGVDTRDFEILLDEAETRDYLWVKREEINNYPMVFNMADNVKQLLGWDETPNVTVIKKAILAGIIPIEKVPDIVKAMNHKYIRREGSPGNWEYIYKEKKLKQKKNEEEQPKQVSSEEKERGVTGGERNDETPINVEGDERAVPKESKGVNEGYRGFIRGLMLKIAELNGVTGWEPSDEQIDNYTKIYEEEKRKLEIHQIEEESEENDLLYRNFNQSSLTAAEIAALKKYHNHYYRGINEYLRTGNDDDNKVYDNLIKDLDSAISKSFLKKDGYVYRIVDNEEGFFNFKEGDEYIENGYSSTTTDRDYLMEQESNFEEPLILKIKLNKGQNFSKTELFRDVEHFESEILLPRGQKFIIKNINGNEIEMEAILTDTNITKSILGEMGDEFVKNLDGLLKNNRTKQDIIDHWRSKVKMAKEVAESIVDAQLKVGIEVEKEHTDDEKVAEKIALDHLWEDLKYYEKLKKVEDIHKSYLQGDITDEEYEQEIEKGKKAVIGETRTWGGVKYKKVSATGDPNKDWQKVKEELSAEKDYLDKIDENKLDKHQLRSFEDVKKLKMKFELAEAEYHKELAYFKMIMIMKELVYPKVEWQDSALEHGIISEEQVWGGKLVFEYDNFQSVMRQYEEKGIPWKIAMMEDHLTPEEYEAFKKPVISVLSDIKKWEKREEELRSKYS